MKRISNALAMAACAAVVVSAVSVRAGQSMSKAATDDMMQATYTGCVEAVNHGGSFLLTHVSDRHMDDMHGEKPMAHDAAMPKAEPDSMDHEAMHMTATAVVLSGKSDLRKHVTVTGALSKSAASRGRDDLNTLSVKSLKVVAKACSQEAQ